MKTLFKSPITMLLFCSLFLCSCAALRLPDMNKISVGMDKKTVIATLGKKPDKVVGAKSYPSGVIEVLEYTTGVHYSSAASTDGRPEFSWLYFYNDKLVQYGHPDGDWQYNADNIAAMQASK